MHKPIQSIDRLKGVSADIGSLLDYIAVLEEELIKAKATREPTKWSHPGVGSVDVDLDPGSTTEHAENGFAAKRSR